MRNWRIWLLAAMISLSQPVLAQEQPTQQFTSQVLVIDSTRLFQESVLGQQIAAKWVADANARSAENAELIAALSAEEDELTVRRATMTVEEFSVLAAEFDARVQDIRQARAATEDAVAEARAAERRAFYDQVRGITGRLMVERGGVVMLDRSSVFLSLGAIDVTDDVIVRIDAAFLSVNPTPEPEQ